MSACVPPSAFTSTGNAPKDCGAKDQPNLKSISPCCSDCGLCLDVCPTDTLGYSKIHDEAGYNRSDFLYDLLEPWADKEEAARERLKEIEAEQAAETRQKSRSEKSKEGET